MSGDKSPLELYAEKLLVDYFKAEEATNYVGHVIEDLDTGTEYQIIMQKIGGETPVQQLQAANERLASMQEYIDKLEGVMERFLGDLNKVGL